jgi:osmotically inducible protein OsmC
MASKASAVWNGTLKEGDGTMKSGSGAVDGPYSFKSRFEEDGSGTNPEELLGAALAGCFSMALSAGLERAGTPAEQVATEALVYLRNDGSGPRVAEIALTTTGRVPGIDEETFRQAAEQTGKECIVSRALGGVDKVTVDAKLES